MAYVEDFTEETNTENSDLFDCDFTSVDDVINRVLVFTGVVQRETENGTRTLIAFDKEDGVKSAFWTDSKKLKEVVLNPERHFPFRAIIKVARWGDFTGFKFFSPNSPVSQDDLDNFNYYKRNKFKRR